MGKMKCMGGECIYTMINLEVVIVVIELDSFGTLNSCKTISEHLSTCCVLSIRKYQNTCIR